MNTSHTGGSVVAGLFNNGAEAEMALAELKNAGYTCAEISEVERIADGAGDAVAEVPASSFARERSALQFSSADAQTLVAAIVRGQALVTVDAGERGTAGATQILNRHSADIYFALAATRGAIT